MKSFKEKTIKVNANDLYNQGLINCLVFIFYGLHRSKSKNDIGKVRQAPEFFNKNKSIRNFAQNLY